VLEVGEPDPGMAQACHDAVVSVNSPQQEPATPEPTRVLVVDDQELFRRGLTMLLAAEDGIEVVGEAGDGIEGVALATRTAPDVVLLDVRMPKRSGIEACQEIKEAVPAAKIIMLTSSDEEADLYEAVKSGASATAMPAAFTRPSMRPQPPTAAASAASTAASLVTSVAMNVAAAPWRAARSSPASWLMSRMTTRPPAATTMSAVAPPRPDAPPVMTIVRPWSCMAASYQRSRGRGVEFRIPAWRFWSRDCSASSVGRFNPRRIHEESPVRCDRSYLRRNRWARGPGAERARGAARAERAGS
jgi:DNA-binding NarL/FixJ family response regulator